MSESIRAGVSKSLFLSNKSPAKFTRNRLPQPPGARGFRGVSGHRGPRTIFQLFHVVKIPRPPEHFVALAHFSREKSPSSRTPRCPLVGGQWIQIPPPPRGGEGEGQVRIHTSEVRAAHSRVLSEFVHSVTVGGYRCPSDVRSHLNFLVSPVLHINLYFLGTRAEIELCRYARGATLCDLVCRQTRFHCQWNSIFAAQRWF